MKLIAFALAVMATFASFGNTPADSVKVFFRVGQRQYDPSLNENRLMMDGFIEKVREAANSDNLQRIIVRGYASPDGMLEANERLAHNRCTVIADYIAENAGVSRELIEENPMGVAWNELRLLIADAPEVPSRDEILDIIDNAPLRISGPDGTVVDGRKKQLMDLHGGRPYNWLLANVFPQMRNAVAVTLCFKEQNEPVASAVDVDTVLSENQGDQSETAVVVEAETDVMQEINYESRHRFALKNNILYDAILMPNLEFEWLINKDWSVSLEGDVAWWKPSETKVYRLAIVSPEVRYHIRPRAPWHGMYVGLFVGGGLYQLENGGDGYHGEGGMGGVSFGYMWPIGKHFFMEAAIGAGYMRTEYKVYEHRDGHRVYMRTKSLNYVGPLKLKLSIAWQFDIVSKNKKVSSVL